MFDQTPEGPLTNVIGLLAAIDFLIATKFTFNTVAMNLSLGTDTLSSLGSCATPLDVAFAEAVSVGITPVVAAGNEARADRIALPACSAFAVSVGAVDGNDQMARFSNSSLSLDLLAPGVDVTAAGIEMAGTSQASPLAIDYSSPSNSGAGVVKDEPAEAAAVAAEPQKAAAVDCDGPDSAARPAECGGDPNERAAWLTTDLIAHTGVLQDSGAEVTDGKMAWGSCWPWTPTNSAWIAALTIPAPRFYRIFPSSRPLKMAQAGVRL